MEPFNLFKADFRRLFKMKSFFIVLGVLLAYSLAYFGIMRAASALLTAESMTTIQRESLSGVYARMSFGSAIGVSMLGLCIALATGLYVGSDFSQNTIRNKIISGNSRVKIYLSSLLNNVVLGMIYFATATVFATILLLIFYGTNELGTCLIRAAVAIVPYLGLIAIVTFICISLKSPALGIVVGVLVMYLLPNIVSIFEMLAVTGMLSESAANVIEIITGLEPLSLINRVTDMSVTSMMVGTMSDVNPLFTIEAVSERVLIQAFTVPVVWGGALTGLGILKFHFTDIK